jgi:predicted SnoaL-like aldol condensation-catalyzing enzyme
MASAMAPNPYDPWKRADLTANERVVLEFTADCIHGDDLTLIEKYISPDYIQHTAGIGQGREGLRNYLREIAWKRPNRKTWRPIQIFACGDFVILHKLLTMAVVADFFRFDAAGAMAEHWDVVQPLPEPGYDPMQPSSENFARFAALFDIAGRG